MVHDLVITHADIVTPGGVRRGTLIVDAGHITGVAAPDAEVEGAVMIDGHGKHVLPGVVDIHVHFREPGQEYKATYRSESSAAAVGGVTTIGDMPNNGTRAVVDAERLAAKRAVAEASSFVDFGLYAYLTGGDRRILEALVEAGVLGFKWDMSLAGVEVAPGITLPLPDQAASAFRAAAALGAIVGVHAEDRPLVSRLTAALRAAGRRDVAAHVEARPVEAEVLALRRVVALARETGARVHVHHLSSAAGLDLVRSAKREGLPVTAETIPAFLFLDASDYVRLGTVMKIHPAVKYPEDREALWAGLLDGTLDCVATDHAPHTREEKMRDVWEASPGAIGVQTSLALMLTAVSEDRIGLARLVELVAETPARLYGLYPRKGTIEAGADADLVLVDLRAEGTIRNEAMYSPNHLTPFDGRRVRGVPVLTVLRGRVVAEDGTVLGEPRGRQVRPG